MAYTFCNVSHDWIFHRLLSVYDSISAAERLVNIYNILYKYSKMNRNICCIGQNNDMSPRSYRKYARMKSLYRIPGKKKDESIELKKVNGRLSQKINEMKQKNARKKMFVNHHALFNLSKQYPYSYSLDLGSDSRNAFQLEANLPI